MNKLGFAIKLASQGAGNAIECNKGQWTSKVVDIREYLKFFDGLQGTDNTVTFMSFDEGGCYLTLLRAISGRIGDFLSGWIYIPNTIEATGEDIMNAYNYVRNILSQSNLNDSIEDIEAFFSKEYPKKEFAAQYVPSSGEEFGVRFIDMYYSMKEILDADRYQPYYSKFKAIFLLDKNSEVKIAKEQVARFKDLTKITIEKTCIFKAPSLEEVRLLGRGTKIFFSTNQEFKSPVLAKKGDKIQLFAHREGFEPVNLPVVTIQEDGQTYSINPNAVKWMKRISPSMFLVYNSKHEKLENGVQIFINGTEITYKDGLISEEDCRQAKVKIIAPDYETFEQKTNLFAENYSIILSRKVKSCQTKVELTNGHLAEMTLESKYLPSQYESPLKGYEFDEEYHSNKVLRMSLWFVWKQRLWGFFAALSVCVLIIAYIALDTWLETHDFKFGLPPWEENSSAQQYTPVDSTNTEDRTLNQADNRNESDQQGTEDISIDAAISYLDTNTTWSKTELDKYPDLQGLYEDMNTFNLSKILNDWSFKLENSKQFQKILESANKTYSYGWNPKQGVHNPTYNKAGDEQISLPNYINWLDRDQTPKPKPNNVVIHPNIEPNGGKSTGKTVPSSGKSAKTVVKQKNVKSENTKNGGL